MSKWKKSIKSIIFNHNLLPKIQDQVIRKLPIKDINMKMNLKSFPEEGKLTTQNWPMIEIET